MSLIVTVGLLIFFFCFGMSDNAKNNAAARRDKQRSIETGSTWYTGGGYKKLYSTKGDRLVEIQYDKYSDRLLLWDVYKGYWLEEDGKFVPAYPNLPDQRVINYGKPKKEYLNEREDAIRKGKTVYHKYEPDYKKHNKLFMDIYIDVNTGEELYCKTIIDHDTKAVFSYYSDKNGFVLRASDFMILSIDNNRNTEKERKKIESRCCELMLLLNEFNEKHYNETEEYSLVMCWENACNNYESVKNQKSLEDLYKIKDGKIYL